MSDIISAKFTGSKHSDSISLGYLTGNNTVYGLGGDDEIYCGSGDDTLDGGTGNDKLSGGGGTDTASYSGATGSVKVNLSITTAQAVGGGLGSDTLDSIENLIGSGYADTLTGNSGANVLTGGSGNDTLNGGSGTDTAVYSDATSGVTVSLLLTSAQVVGGGLGSDTLVSIENLAGSNYGDTLTGSSGNNVLKGSGGNDTINGNLGNDLLYGGTGNDTLNGGSGTDTAAYSDATSGVTVSLLLTSAQAVGGGQGSDTLISIENLIGSGYGDILTGDSGANSLVGRSGNDTLIGGGGIDTLNGGDGNDTISFTGGQLIAVDNVDGGAGTDTVLLNGDYTGVNALVMNATTMVDVEKMTLSAGHSYKLTTNNATVAAGQILTINGSALGASDVLTFNGTAEADGRFIIWSGSGADKLAGGGGADTVVYGSAAQSTSTHYDTITGFNFAADRFDIPGGAGVITGIDAKVTSGSLSTASFDADLTTAMSGHLGVHHAVLFTPTSGTLSGQTFLVVDFNGTAGYQANADLVIRMNGTSGTLAAGGFH